MNNTPRSSNVNAGRSHDRGGNYWTLFTPGIWKGLHAVLQLEGLLEMRQPHLSQHLTRLQESGLVKTRRVSRMVYYRLGSEAAERVISLLHELFCAKDAASAPTVGGTPPADDTTPDP